MLSIGEFLMHYIAYAIGINLLQVFIFFLYERLQTLWLVRYTLLVLNEL